MVTASNGEDAVAVASQTTPNLILMDISMPTLDGLGATRRIREDATLRNIPVIAVTAHGTEGFQRAAYDVGVSGYLTKPIDLDRMRHLIALLLSPSGWGNIQTHRGHPRLLTIQFAVCVPYNQLLVFLAGTQLRPGAVATGCNQTTLTLASGRYRSRFPSCGLSSTVESTLCLDRQKGVVMEPRIDYLKSARGAYHAMLGIEHYLQQCGLEESLLHLIMF